MCSCCGRKRDANRVERGLFVCESCGTMMNADVSGAVNIRRKRTQNPPTGDMSNGRLARPAVCLFNPRDVSHRANRRIANLNIPTVVGIPPRERGRGCQSVATIPNEIAGIGRH